MDEVKPPQKVNWLAYFIKLERLSAWVLFFVFITFGVTGYGMATGLLPFDLSSILHHGWLGAIVLAPFIIHTSWGISLSLKRRRVWNRFTRAVLIAFYVLLVSFFLWVHFFYQSY